MDHPNPAPEHKGAIFGGIALLVVGLVILVPSGLCTGLLLFMPIVQALQHPGRFYNFGSLGIVLIVGGPFVIGGAVLVWKGFKTLRAHFREPDKT